LWPPSNLSPREGTAGAHTTAFTPVFDGLWGAPTQAVLSRDKVLHDIPND